LRELYVAREMEPQDSSNWQPEEKQFL